MMNIFRFYMCMIGAASLRHVSSGCYSVLGLCWVKVCEPQRDLIIGSHAGLELLHKINSVFIREQ